jgi:hypothetical protein
MAEQVLFCRAEKQSTAFGGRQSFAELGVICAVAGGCGTPTLQARCLILILRNQSRRVAAIILKWVITEGRNTEHRGLRISSRRTFYGRDRFNSRPYLDCVTVIIFEEECKSWSLRSAAAYRHSVCRLWQTDRHIQRLYEYCRLLVLNAVRQIVCACRTELPLVRLSCWFIELCCQQMWLSSSLRPGFNCRPPSVALAVYKLALGQVFLPALTCFPISIIPFRLHQCVIQRMDNGPTGGHFHRHGLLTPPQDNSTDFINRPAVKLFLCFFTRVLYICKFVSLHSVDICVYKLCPLRVLSFPLSPFLCAVRPTLRLNILHQRV